MYAIRSLNRNLFSRLIFIALMVIASCSGTSKNPPISVKSQPGTQTTFILVRHAERAKAQGESALRPEGRERAQALVEALGNMGVTAIYSPDRGRNRETVQPLADHLGLTVNLISEDRLFNTREFANEFVEAVLLQHAGGVVVWVGNKSPVGIWGGNLQEIYKQLGGVDRAPSTYDDLFIMVVTDTGELKVTETTYGQKAGKFDQ